MAVFILLMSFFPALCPLSILIILSFPVTFLSFPFYAYSMRIDSYYDRGIIFFTVDIISSTEIPYPGEPFRFVVFLFFLFVNILGALLGYWMGKKHRIQYSVDKRWIALVGIVILGFCFFPFIWGYDLLQYIGWRVFYALFGFGISLLETIFLSYLLNI